MVSTQQSQKIIQVHETKKSYKNYPKWDILVKGTNFDSGYASDDLNFDL